MSLNQVLETQIAIMNQLVQIKAASRSYAKITLNDEQHAEYLKLYAKEQREIFINLKELYSVFENLEIPDEDSW